MTVLSTTFRVGYRYRASLSIDLAAIKPRCLLEVTCAWSPKRPSRLSEQELADYQAGRDRFYEEVGRQAGIRITVVDIATSAAPITMCSQAPAPAAGIA